MLCSASPTEWSEVWDSLRCRGETETLDILYNAFSLITVAESENRTDSTRACMLYCLRNLALVTKVDIDFLSFLVRAARWQYCIISEKDKEMFRQQPLNCVCIYELKFLKSFLYFKMLMNSN